MIKKAQKNQLSQKTLEELTQELAKLRLELVSKRQDLKTQKSKNTRQVKTIRYQIALVNTLINQHKLNKPQPKKASQ